MAKGTKRMQASQRVRAVVLKAAKPVFYGKVPRSESLKFLLWPKKYSMNKLKGLSPSHKTTRGIDSAGSSVGDNTEYEPLPRTDYTASSGAAVHQPDIIYIVRDDVRACVILG